MAQPRLQSVDLLRGVAVLLMIAYHFSYDLNWFGFARFDFYTDPFWLHARTLILSLFLFVAGVSLALANGDGVRWRPYLRRLGYLLGAAALVSLASHLLFGPRWIFFGVLHFIAVASLLGLLFVRRPVLALLLGVALIALDRLYNDAVFDQSALQWIGLMTYRPPTEDYVPLIPWFGVVLFGVAAGSGLISAVPRSFRSWEGGGAPLRLLTLAGRHSLLIYLLHQPVLMAALWTTKAALGDGRL